MGGHIYTHQQQQQQDEASRAPSEPNTSCYSDKHLRSRVMVGIRRYWSLSSSGLGSTSSHTTHLHPQPPSLEWNQVLAVFGCAVKRNTCTSCSLGPTSFVLFTPLLFINLLLSTSFPLFTYSHSSPLSCVPKSSDQVVQHSFFFFITFNLQLYFLNLSKCCIPAVVTPSTDRLTCS